MDIALIGTDIEITNGVPVQDGGLETAVNISLFTDARDSDFADPRGWWEDSFDDYPLGSKLWTLARAKMLDTITDTAKSYCDDALKWMLDDGIAETIVVTVTKYGKYAIIITIKITKPDDTSESYAYKYNWEEQQSDPVHAR